MYREQRPHLLRNFPVAASGEKLASNSESMWPMFWQKYWNFAAKLRSE